MEKKKISRREFLGQAASCMAAVGAAPLFGSSFFKAPYLKNKRVAKKVIILGIDGMDPVLLRQFLARGEMPTFRKLMASGSFSPLATTMPPQSPVAWSSFITGCNPGGHGIFDFIHRDAADFQPYLSTSRSFGSATTLDIGKWSLPIKGGRVENLRRGPAFWTSLEEQGIPSTIHMLPANFPITSAGGSKQLSGMGTPDLLGTYGTFTYFTDAHVPGAEELTGGRVVKVDMREHSAKAVLEGPKNAFRNDKEYAGVELILNRDPWEPVARVKVQDHELILKQGEWTDWVPLKFEFMPMFASVSGIVRFYLQEVHPHFRLYVSPINIDPMESHIPICSPSNHSKELSQAIGRFYTQGFPEDTKALSAGIFSTEEFFTQTKSVLHENLKSFEYQFSNFNEGLFFFYFSSIDQNSHMLLRMMDPAHPLYEPDASPETKDAIYYFYRQMDNVLKQVLSKTDENTLLMVLSDHGFAPFTREINVSTWLVENGYTVLTDPSKMEQSQFYNYVDWSKTKAYVMGLNGIYLNLEGREKQGSVRPEEAEKLIVEIIAKLREVRDPANCRRVFIDAYDARRIYSGPFLGLAPDIILGYERGYRISDEAVLGKFPKGIVRDREDKWSADHCMDHSIVPGVLLSNRSLSMPNPGLWDMAPTILQAFGLKPPREMDGKVALEV